MKNRINYSTDNERISWIQKVGYGLGEAGGNFSFSIVSTYLTVFYTDIVGLAPMAISIIMLVARVWDAINDPMMGIIAEKTNTRLGKYRPYLLFAPPLLAVFTALAFYNPGWFGIKSILYCAITYILTGMSYTATGVAFQALANVMTRNNEERMILISLRGLIGNIATLVVNATMMPVILYFGEGDTSNGRGYFLAAIVFGIIGTVCYWITFATSKERITEQPVKDEKKESIMKNVILAFKEPDIRKLLIGYLFYMSGVFARVGIMAYMFIYICNEPNWMAVAGTVMTFAMMVPNLIQPYFAKRFDKKKIMIVSLVIGFIGGIILFIGGQIVNLPIICIGTALYHGCGTMCGGIAFGLIAEIIDDMEVRTGKRADAIVLSVTSFAVKLGNAIAGSVGILALSAVGFVANAELTAGTKVAMNGVINLGTGVLFLLACIPFAMIKMNNAKAKENTRILEERHSAVQE